MNVYTGKRVNLPAESTLVCVYMRKKVTHLPEKTTSQYSARACSDLSKLRSRILLLSHFDQVDPVKLRNCLYRETLIRLDVACEQAH